MQRRLSVPDWRSLSWWLAVLGIALTIKHHYSIATAADLDWMLRPLSLLLEWLSGHSFHRDQLQEWVSVSADVRLVKACAGINFMLMSLLAWAWVFRPCHGNPDVSTWIGGRILLLLAVLVAAWSSSLLANSLRILITMNLPDPGTQVHRLIGLTVYVPLLSLQLLGGRGNWQAALLGPVILYSLVMALVPLLTSNALKNPALFFDHLLNIGGMAAAMITIYLVNLGLSRRHIQRPEPPRSDHPR